MLQVDFLKFKKKIDFIYIKWKQWLMVANKIWKHNNANRNIINGFVKRWK